MAGENTIYQQGYDLMYQTGSSAQKRVVFGKKPNKIQHQIEMHTNSSEIMPDKD